MNGESVATCILEAAILPSVSEVRRCGKCGRSAADLLAGKSCGVSGESPAAEVLADEVRQRRLDNGRALLLARDEVIADELAVQKAEADRAEVVRLALIADLYQRERAWEVACRKLDDDRGATGQARMSTSGYPDRDDLPSTAVASHVNFLRVWVVGLGSFPWSEAVAIERDLKGASTAFGRPSWDTIDRSTAEAYQRTRAAWDAERDRELREWCAAVVKYAIMAGGLRGVAPVSAVDASGRVVR